LWQTNAMIRYFLAQRKIEAVKRAFAVVPSDSIQVLVLYYGDKSKLPTKAECSIREFLCHQTYLTAVNGYNDWIEFFYNKKPKKPALVQGRNFAEKAASEHQETIYQQSLERWKIELKEQTQSAKGLLYNVLMFPDKGWLIDGDDIKIEYESEDDVTAWENRKIQMENLRKLHIPDIVALLHNMLTLAEEYKECMQLCDELASEQNQLYNVFSKHKMSEFLAKIAESSLALVNEKYDSFGFNAN
jgi:nuclear pore complex protein Nup107